MSELYVFLISLEGSYFIIRDAPGSPSGELLQRGKIAASIRGLGATNRIRAECIGGEQESRLILSMNGDRVVEATGGTGKMFDRTAFFVTTLHALANSTHAVDLVSKKSPGSPSGFAAEVFFDNFVLTGLP